MSLMHDLLDNQTPQKRLAFLNTLFASITKQIDHFDTAAADDVIPVAVDFLEKKYQFKTNDPMNLDILQELLSSWDFEKENVNRNSELDEEKDTDMAKYLTVQNALLFAIYEAQNAIKIERQPSTVTSKLAEQMILLSASCDEYTSYLDSIIHKTSKNESNVLLASQKKEITLEAKRALLDDDTVPLIKKIEQFYAVLNDNLCVLNKGYDHVEMTFLKQISVRLAALLGLMPGTAVYRSLFGATVNEKFMKSVEMKEAISSIKKEEQTGFEASDFSRKNQ